MDKLKSYLGRWRKKRIDDRYDYRKRKLWEPYPGWTGKGKVYPYHLEMNWRYLHFWKSDEWKRMKAFLKERSNLGIEIHPSDDLDIIFKPLIMTPFSNVKIIIIGSEPYHHGERDGLAFSVLPNQKKIPRKLHALFRAYKRDTGFRHPTNGSLNSWAHRGILLINAIWTLERGIRRSHMFVVDQAWKKLTSEILTALEKKKDKVVFIYMGYDARRLAHLTRSSTKHLTLEVPAPSHLANIYGDKIDDYNVFTTACKFLGISKDIWRLP